MMREPREPLGLRWLLCVTRWRHHCHNALLPSSSGVSLLVGSFHALQRERLCSHDLQRESSQTMALHCKSYSAAGNRGGYMPAQDHSDPPRSSSLVRHPSCSVGTPKMKRAHLSDRLEEDNKKR